MQERTRADEPQQQREQQQREHQRERPETSQQRDREQTARVRIPKIQYRFLQELKTKGVTEDARQGAFAMADRIKQYPVGEREVMASWERFTRGAIADFKAKRGDADERDRQHAAYAVLFSAVRDQPPAHDAQQLTEGIANVEVALRWQTGRDASRVQSRGGQERPAIEQQIDKAIDRLKTLSPQLRATIERHAAHRLANGAEPQHARKDLPEQVKRLQAEKSETNASEVMVMSVVARAPEQRAMLAEIGRMKEDQREVVVDAARLRVENYTDKESRLWDIRRDASVAAVRDVLEPSPKNHREALVLAEAREKIEAVDDPARTNLARVGEELAKELTW